MTPASKYFKLGWKLRSKKATLEEETLNELKEAFDLFDTGHNNAIDSRELKAVMKAFGLDVKKEDVRNALKSIGKDVTDTIVFDEFVKIMAPRIVH
jgi:Ca2+-binding protein (EF-Hand superfamily)